MAFPVAFWNRFTVWRGVPVNRLNHCTRWLMKEREWTDARSWVDSWWINTGFRIVKNQPSSQVRGVNGSIRPGYRERNAFFFNFYMRPTVLFTLRVDSYFLTILLSLLDEPVHDYGGPNMHVWSNNSTWGLDFLLTYFFIVKISNMI
jgi:hypothetical protein